MSLADKLLAYRRDPALMVREQFGVEPDPWQLTVLDAFPWNQRMALLACKGPGKTCVLAWLAWNFLLTRPAPNLAATSVTGDQLADGFWKEMAKWRDKSALLKQMFEWTKTRISHRQYPETWWMSARTWPHKASPTEQAATLSGLHADYIMFILDESGGIPTSVMATADAALSGCIEGHILQAGNPTHREGPLYDAWLTHRQMWWVIEITGDPDDPNRTSRMPVEWARQQIQMYGREDPFVLVNVFGKFPPSSLNVLLGPDDIQAAMARHYTERDIAGASRVLGVDVARYGDDASCIFPRQGLVAFRPKLYRKLDGTEGGGQTARIMDDFKADGCFIDDTGGYGAAWIDQLRRLGRSPIPVAFSNKPIDPRFHNKRAEMYWDAAEWVKNGGQLPGMEVPGMVEFMQAMTRTQYSYQKDDGRLIMEDKMAVKQRLGASPDVADAFVLTFAFPVSSLTVRRSMPSHRASADFDYAAVVTGVKQTRPAMAQGDYNPYGS